MIPTIYNCFRQKSVYLMLPKIVLPLIQLLLRQYGLVKTSGGPKFDYSWQLHSHTFKGLGNSDHIKSSSYLQDIFAYVWTLSSHENQLLRLLLSELWGLWYAQSAWYDSALRVWLFRDRFSVAPSSYKKLVGAVYRQRMYLYLVQFSGMLHCWLQRYHATIRTLGSSLVYHCLEVRHKSE